MAPRFRIGTLLLLLGRANADLSLPVIVTSRESEQSGGGLNQFWHFFCAHFWTSNKQCTTVLSSHLFIARFGGMTGNMNHITSSHHFHMLVFSSLFGSRITIWQSECAFNRKITWSEQPIIWDDFFQFHFFLSRGRNYSKPDRVLMRPFTGWEGPRSIRTLER